MLDMLLPIIIANAALGVLALLVVNDRSPTLVTVDPWTVLVAAVGGIPGLLATIVLHSMVVV
jgi:hypothetical protein